MEENEEIDPRTVIEWEGFIAEVEDDMLFCRLVDLDPNVHDETLADIPKESFLKLLRESQPDRVDDIIKEDFPRGLIFKLKVDGDAGVTTLTLPPAWTAEDIAEMNRRGEEAAEKWRAAFGDGPE